jgi:hypothetical protein
MNPRRFEELLAGADADVLADLPYLSESELFGLYLFLLRLSGG